MGNIEIGRPAPFVHSGIVYDSGRGGGRIKFPGFLSSGRGELPNNNVPQSAWVQIYDRDLSGHATISPATAPVLTMNTGIKLRGRSSAGFPKKSYCFELLDENGVETDAPVLGMPGGSDGALVG